MHINAFESNGNAYIMMQNLIEMHCGCHRDESEKHHHAKHARLTEVYN